MKIRLARLKKEIMQSDVALSMPCWLSQFSFSEVKQPTGQSQSNVRKKKKINRANLITFGFHCAHFAYPNLCIYRVIKK